MRSYSEVVIPAKVPRRVSVLRRTGIQFVSHLLKRKFKAWIPAFAGMTIAVLLQEPVSLAQEMPFKPTRETLTLQASLDRAYRNNPQLLEAEKELSIARVHSREAKSLFYPKVNLNLNYTRYRNETLGLTTPELGSTILQPTLPSASATDPLTESLYYGRMGFVQTLFAGGRVNTTYQLSKANIKRAESDYETLKREVEFETTQNFFTLLALKEKKDRVKQAIAESDRLVRNGSSTKGKVAVLRKKSELRKKLSQFEQEEERIKMDYLQLMGIELFNDVDIRGSLEPPAVEPNLQKVLAWAKQNRADLRQTELQAEVDQLSVNLSLAERYPVFLLGGSVEMQDQDFPLEDNNWNTGITMNIPLFDGFSSLSRIKASKYRAEQGRLRKVQLEDQVERDVRSAYHDFVYWKSELIARNSELETVDRESRSADRLESMDWRLEAQLSVIEAQQSLQLAKAALEKSVGRPLTE